MKPSVLLRLGLAIGLSVSPLIAQEPATSLPAKERLALVEEQLTKLLEEVRSIRTELDGKKGSGTGTRGAATPTAETEMQQGVIAKTYVRTGGADINSLPAPKATPSDERLEAGSQFSAMNQSQAAGYNFNTTAATIVWEGYFKVEEADVYEFLFSSGFGAVQVGPKVLSYQGEKSVRLDLKPGYWPVKIHGPNNVYDAIGFRVKRSGLDPVFITPGSLWSPKTAP